MSKRIDREEKADPVLGKFLKFLASDIEKNKQILPVSAAWLRKAKKLVKGVKVDLARPLKGRS